MVQARRAATDDEAPLEAEYDGSARRAEPRVRRARTVAVAGLAGLLGLGGLSLWLPGQSQDDAQTQVASPAESTQKGVSRNASRPELTTPAPSVSPTPSVATTPPPTTQAPATTAQTTPPAPAPATTTAAPSPSKTATPAPSTKTPTPSYPKKLAKEMGERWTTASVHVRKGPGAEHESRGVVEEGSALTIADARVDGWQQVSVDGKPGWVKASFLTKKKPKAEATSTASAKASAKDAKSNSKDAKTSSTTGVRSSSSKQASGQEGSSKAVNTAPCSKVSGIEGGLTARTVNVARSVCHAFPDISTFLGRRSGGGSYHNSGRAIDVMVSGERGWEVARWARANASRLGITEVIYEQKIWTSQRSGDGWRSMSNRGSVSANHYDHVHISVR